MEVHILASGSTGNAVYIEMGNRRFLIDAGISCRRIERGLADIGVKVSDLHGLLITHEHSDHIKGLDVLVRKHEVPVYARSATWEKISCRKKLPGKCCRDLGDSLDMGKVKVETFSTSHDAADPVGFCFYYQNHKFVLATDTGKVTPALREAVSYADVLVLESNHDVQMVKEGDYPHFLKQRILGELGHLSNQQAGELLAELPHKQGMQVFLAHLSQNNNYPGLAERTVRDILESRGCAVGEEIILNRTHVDSTASLIIQ